MEKSSKKHVSGKRCTYTGVEQEDKSGAVEKEGKNTTVGVKEARKS